MRTTIDGAGRLVIPKALRDELGLDAGMELDVEAVDGRLQIAVPSKVRLEDGPFGPRFAVDSDESLSAEDVRRILERTRR